MRDRRESGKNSHSSNNLAPKRLACPDRGFDAASLARRAKKWTQPVQSVIPPGRFSVCMVYVHFDYSLCPRGNKGEVPHRHQFVPWFVSPRRQATMSHTQPSLFSPSHVLAFGL